MVLVSPRSGSVQPINQVRPQKARAGRASIARLLFQSLCVKRRYNMGMLTKKNSEYTKGQRIVTALVAFPIFAIIGGVVRLFNGSISLESTNQLLMQFLPMMFLFGFVAAILAYFFPKVFQIIMCFIPMPGVNS